MIEHFQAFVKCVGNFVVQLNHGSLLIRSDCSTLKVSHQIAFCRVGEKLVLKEQDSQKRLTSEGLDKQNASYLEIV